MKFAVAACFVTFIAAASGSAAKAADASYIGTWKLAGAVVAPWADPKRKPDGTEMTRLIGKTIVFQAKQIAGPQPFACKAPHYQESDFTADMLFQGAFEEMQSRNKSVDPDKLATSLGFAGKKVKTLETGCEMDFHFVDAATAEIGLNDYVYTLKKQ
ncbi:MAG: hypothetical protein WCA28_01850 [Bradyrhizobium sp.]